MKKYSTATRIKAYSNNFALYRVDNMEGLNIIDTNGKPTTTDRNIIGVSHLNFTGWAKGKTGKHALNADNTEKIVVGTIRVLSDGKLIANDWHLVNQDEVNKLYSQRVEFNI